jgi:iron(III) transport system substrate-binding protein
VAAPTSGGSQAAASVAAPSAPAAAAGCDVHPYDDAAVYAKAKAEGNMVWTADSDLEVAQPYIDAFQTAYPDVRIDYQLTSGDTAERFIAEHRAGALSMDVYNPAIDFVAYRDAGMITDMTEVLTHAGIKPEAILNGIAQDEYLTAGIGYNKELVADADVPTKWEDILDPKWQGVIAIDNRLRPFIYATPTWGEPKVTDFLTKLAAQKPLFRQGESATTALLLAGESKLVIGSFLQSTLEHTNDPWAWDDKLDEVFSVQSQGDGSTYSPDAPHPCAAALWIHWYYGPEATKIRNEVRFTGDPRPGSGTGPSQYLEQHGQTIHMAGPDIDLAFRDMQAKYLAVMGVQIQ